MTELPRAKEFLSREKSIMTDLHKLGDSLDEIAGTEAPPAVNLKHLEDELTRNRLDEIALLVCALTYGEMIELAEGLWQAKEGEGLYGGTLAPTFHKWSMSRV